MDTVSALDMLVRSAEEASFSAAARQLGVTPAAVSKQVAALEKSLGVRLVQRSTRRLALTEAGVRLVSEATPGLRQVQAALAATNQKTAAVSGVLKVSLAPAFGRRYVLPLMGPLLDRHPGLRLDWHFENRQVDLIGEGFDAGISGGVDINSGLTARALVPLHLVVVAAPEYLKRRGDPAIRRPEDLAAQEALLLRSPNSGRTRPWLLKNGAREMLVEPSPRIWVSDPEALCDAVVEGYGIALAALTHVRPHLDSGALVRLLPRWWCDGGMISVYFPSGRLMPAKTRVFVDHLTESMRAAGLGKRLSA
jgi:DNA-binding transcriptional LysR family regulator